MEQEQDRVPKEPNEIEPTWGIALTVWWTWTWRAFLTGLASGAVAGFVLGIIEAIVSGSAHLSAGYTLFNIVVGAALGFFWSIFFLKKILTKIFSSFRIAVLKK